MRCAVCLCNSDNRNQEPTNLNNIRILDKRPDTCQMCATNCQAFDIKYMASVNKTLLISLKEDIKVLNKAVESISLSDNEDIEIMSWLFPNKPYQFVNELIEQNQIYDETNFRIYLELIIDRLYVGIRLILNYAHKITGLEENNEFRFLQRPKQLTLGFTFTSLWKLVSGLIQKMQNNHTKIDITTTKKGNNTATEIVNKQTQTDIISLNKCDSCSSAMLCMKNLLKSFESEDNGNITTRKLIRPQLYDITQFGCMLRTTSTIENNIDTLLKNINEKKQENYLLEMENQKLKSEIDHSFGKITLLEREVEIFKEKYDKDMLKINCLKTENEELIQIKIKNEFQVKHFEEIIIKLNKSIESQKEIIKKHLQEKENLSKHINTIFTKQAGLTKVNLLLQKKLSTIENEHSLIKNIISNFENVIDRINSKLIKSSKYFEIIYLKVGRVTKEHQENSDFILSSYKNLKKSVTKYTVEISIRESKNLQSMQVSSFKVKGDPIEDISKQMDENEKKIKLLQTENIKLQTIIDRFNCLK